MRSSTGTGMRPLRTLVHHVPDGPGHWEEEPGNYRVREPVPATTVPEAGEDRDGQRKRHDHEDPGDEHPPSIDDLRLAHQTLVGAGAC